MCAIAHVQMWTTYRLPTGVTKGKAPKRYAENREQRRWEYTGARVTCARARDHMIVSRFSLNLRYSGRRGGTTPTTSASRKAFSREAVLLFNGSTLKSELLYNRQLSPGRWRVESSLDRKLHTRLARKRARINKFHVRPSYSAFLCDYPN